MRKLLKKRWHHIPVALIVALLVLVLATGGALAVYPFLSGQINLTVTEPITVSYDWPGDGVGYLPLPDSFDISISGYAGDSETFDLKVCNAANTAIDVATVLGGSTGKITVTGLPGGSITAESCWTGAITVSINGDTPDGSYVITVVFTRG